MRLGLLPCRLVGVGLRSLTPRIRVQFPARQPNVGLVQWREYAASTRRTRVRPPYPTPVQPSLVGYAALLVAAELVKEKTLKPLPLEDEV